MAFVFRRNEVRDQGRAPPSANLAVVLMAVLRCEVLFNFVVHRMCLMVRTMQMLRRQVLRSCDASAKHHCDCGLIRKAVRPPSSRA